MDSKSDWTTMQRAAEVLAELGVPYESRIVSAHRTPGLLFEYVGNAEARGIQVIIAGAGGAAHLSGMAAAKTTLPVLGVPVQSKALQGLDHRQTLKEHPPAKFGLLARLSRGPKRSVGCYVSIGTAAKTKPKPEIGGRVCPLKIPGMGLGFAIVGRAVAQGGSGRHSRNWRGWSGERRIAGVIALGDPSLKERLKAYRIRQTTPSSRRRGEPGLAWRNHRDHRRWAACANAGFGGPSHGLSHRGSGPRARGTGCAGGRYLRHGSLRQSRSRRDLGRAQHIVILDEDIQNADDIAATIATELEQSVAALPVGRWT